MDEQPRRGRFLVEIEACPIEPAACSVLVTTSRLELARLARGEFRPDERPHVFVGQRQFAGDPQAWALFAGRLTVLAGRGAAPLHEMAGDLHRLSAGCLFMPATADNAEAIRRTAELGIPVRLACDAAWPETMLNDLLAFFLHAPGLEAPIEPFYSLAAAIAGRARLNLWRLSGEVPGRSLFVDSRGRVSLSRRWAGRDMFFGNVDDAPACFRETLLWRELTSLKHRLFVTQSPCAFCEHYLCCGGFWTTFENGDAACATWRRLMDRLAATYRQEIRRMQQCDGEHPAEHLTM